MKRIILSIGLIFSFSSTAHAQQVEGISLEEMPIVKLPKKPIRQPGEYGELQYWLNKKDIAPYSGIIVNPEGWSYILTEYQSLELRAQATLKAQRKQDHAYINLKIGELQIELNNFKEVAEIKTAAREADLKRCQERTEIIIKDHKKQTRRGKILYGTAGVAVGVVMALLLQAFAF